MKNAIDRVSEPRETAFLGFNLGDGMARPLYRWRRWFQLLLLGFLASLWLIWPIGYQAQAILINDNLVATFPTLRPNIPVYQQGDIAYADVTLDGGRSHFSFIESAVSFTKCLRRRIAPHSGKKNSAESSSTGSRLR
ncbi:MAG: hypothetical protein IGR76_12555 [Synechococcales cyanobacterium T60_A2020_003]|nr:hypothetical protein [Synechococcales cyanobacterium T60_A2020_003]